MCTNLHSVVSGTAMAQHLNNSSRNASDIEEWRLLQVAYASLLEEGAEASTQTLAARLRLLRTSLKIVGMTAVSTRASIVRVAGSSTTAGHSPLGTASSASASTSGSSSLASSAGALQVRQRERAMQSVAHGSRSTSSSQAGRLGSVKQEVDERRIREDSPTSASASAAATPQSSEKRGGGAARQQPSSSSVKKERRPPGCDLDNIEVHELKEAILPATSVSINAKLTGGTPANSLTRSRGIVNGYALAMSEPMWYVTNLWSTLTAMQRRLLAQQIKLEATTHLVLLDCFDQLRQRSIGILLVHRSLTKWQSSGYNDEKLLPTLTGMDILQPFFDEEATSVSAPLQIAILRASAFRLFLNDSAIAPVVDKWDMDKAKLWCDDVEANRADLMSGVRPQPQKKGLANVGNQDPNADSQKEGPIDPVAATCEHGHIIYLQALIDMLLQKAIVSFTKDEDLVAERAHKFQLDMEKLEAVVLQKGLAEGPDDDFAKAIGSLRFIMQCLAAEAGLTFPPSPSLVVSARHHVEVMSGRQATASSSCRALNRYPQLKPVHDAARRRCAVGRGDACGDNEFGGAIQILRATAGPGDFDAMLAHGGDHTAPMDQKTMVDTVGETSSALA